MSAYNQRTTKVSLPAHAFGTWLKRERKRRQLSLRDMAEFVGISHPSIRAYEMGQREPTLGVAVKLARSLGYSLDTLKKCVS